MTLKNRFLIGIVFLSFLFLACSKEPDCENERPYDKVRVVFYDVTAETATELDTAFRSIEAIWQDSSYLLFDDSLATGSAFDLELNPYTNASLYVFESVRGTFDTFQIDYDKELEWLSDECGPQHRFENISIGSETDFDSVTVVQELINAQVDENIRIYL